MRSDIQRTGQTIRQLITDEVQRNSGPYNRTLEYINLDLDSLQPIGNLLHFCLRLTDLYSRDIGERCFDQPTALSAPLDAMMRQVIGTDAIFQGTIGQYPGINVGQVTITPNYGSELIALGKNLINLLAVSLTILLMSFLIYRPVRKALAPADAMLATLKRMENGDLDARMPTFPLIEFDHIGQGFNHLAERLQQTDASQRRLAHRLLSAREEERLHLSRELHDEFGQYLASLNAEASFALELANEGVPALRPCAESIGQTASHMMETLQQILHRLRPLGLEEFGLRASLQQLIDEWNRRACPNTRFQLLFDTALDTLPDNVAVTLYRIVQESLTNAVRHGQASEIDVVLTVDAGRLRLLISDNGCGGVTPEISRQAPKPGGFGLLGIEERVVALGGSLHILARQPRGTVIDVALPAPETLEQQR